MDLLAKGNRLGEPALAGEGLDFLLNRYKGRAQRFVPLCVLQKLRPGLRHGKRRSAGERENEQAGGYEFHRF
jgi:hypothetical protein